MAKTDTATDQAAPTGGAGRGRPRPQEVIERDAQVLAKLNELGRPVTRVEVAEAMGIESKMIYLSLYRLRLAGHVERARADGAHVWSVTPAGAEYLRAAG